MSTFQDDEVFYDQLPSFARFIDVAAAQHYVPAPDDWLLVISDVIGSTKAIAAGRYKDVNAVGVSCIVAVKNALGSLNFPYVFGGDGATLLIPKAAAEKVAAALHGVRRAADDAFDLDLRVGAVHVAELRALGCDLKVARFRASDHANFAMFAGGGLAEAERRIKDPELGARYALPPPKGSLADLSGFECRWQPIPSRRGRIVSLLVQALGPEPEAARTYARVLGELDRITQGIEASAPVHQGGLRLNFVEARGDQEARLFSGSRCGWGYWRARWRILCKVLIGWYLLWSGRSAGGFDGVTYRQQLIENSDFRKFDGTLRLVLDLTPEQAAELRSVLENERSQRNVAFGLHTAKASLITCVISSYDYNHVHFVDGADGGYALAALELKAQLKS